VARELGVKPEEVVEMETRLSGQDVALEPNGDEDEERYAPIAYLPDPGAEPSQAIETEQEERLRSSGLANALASLDPRSRRIIEARWLREKDSATLHELAAEFNVSAELIRQIEAKALTRMKGALAAPA
jgi:RNA polymerase sigma-32 factor